MTRRVIGLWLALLAPVTDAAGQASPDPGSEVYRTRCTGCHGSDGRAVPGAGFEALAGVDKAQLMQKLRDFRSGARPATIMHQISRGYTEAQLELIAAYFAARK